MKTNYSTMKLSFIQYLAAKANIDIDLSEIENTSIFSYNNEFQEYLANEYNIDANSLSYNLKDLLSLKLSEGKLSLDENPDFAGSVDDSETIALALSEAENLLAQLEEPNINSTENAENQEDDNKFLLDYINDFLQDEDVKKAIDTDGNEELSNQEIENFFNKISVIDENADNISLSDLMKAIETIHNGTFDGIQGMTDDTSLYGQTYESPEAVAAAAISNGYNGSSYYPKKTDAKQINQMTVAELKQEQSSAEVSLANKQIVLSSVLNGTHPDFAELKNKIQTSKSDYLNSIGDEKLASELEEAISQI